MVSKNNDGQINILADATTEHFRRQDTPQSFNLTTVAYVLSSEFVLNNKSIFSGRVKAVEIPAERAIDIDNLLDFEIAEFLMTRKVK
jgi:N-acylneuraminate cytidylyltransferase